MNFIGTLLLAVLVCVATEWLYRQSGIWRER